MCQKSNLYLQKKVLKKDMCLFKFFQCLTLWICWRKQLFSQAHVCLNMWKEWINETPMAGVIHAKRTTVWTGQASSQTKIPSSLLAVCVEGHRNRKRGKWVELKEWLYASKHHKLKSKHCAVWRRETSYRHSKKALMWQLRSTPMCGPILWPSCIYRHNTIDHVHLLPSALIWI